VNIELLPPEKRRRYLTRAPTEPVLIGKPVTNPFVSANDDLAGDEAL